jgi:hypothetical protein
MATTTRATQDGKTAAAATKTDGVLLVGTAKPDIRRVKITVEGLSSLIMHAWSDKAKKMMLDKQTKKASPGREAKSPEEDYASSLYHHPDGGYAFPAQAFKNAAVRAGTYTDDKMTYLRGAFYINGVTSKDWIKIDGEPTPREDMVRVGMGTADIRYRAEFLEWKAELIVEYNARAVSAEQVFNLLSVAGFSVGIGDWRPEKNGSHGRFKVVGQA